VKRLVFVAAAVVASVALTPSARAGSLIATDLVNTGNSAQDAATGTPTGTMSTLNPILNRIPLLSGPDQRHICLISDQVDKSWCFYVAIP
jgi:hypothetical protein